MLLENNLHKMLSINMIKAKFIFITAMLILTSCADLKLDKLYPSKYEGPSPQNAISPPRSDEWNWTFFAVSSTNENQVFMADFTKVEDLDDRYRYLPYVTYSPKDKKITSPVIWVRFTCSSKYTEVLGEYKNGGFKNIQGVTQYAIAAIPSKLLCSFDDGIDGFAAYVRGTKFNLMGFKSKDMKFGLTNNEQTVETKIFEYDFTSRKIIATTEIDLNCTTRTYSAKNYANQIMSPYSLVEHRGLRYFVDKACSYYKAPLIINSPVSIEKSKSKTENVSDKPSYEARNIVNEAWAKMDPKLPEAKRNYKQAYALNLKGFALGHAEGASNIGLLYEKGYGVSRNIILAEEWYLKAISFSQHHSAQAELGMARIYLQKAHTDSNLSEAAEYLRQARITASNPDGIWKKSADEYLQIADKLESKLADIISTVNKSSDIAVKEKIINKNTNKSRQGIHN
jgi:TPR repeat protein